MTSAENPEGIASQAFTTTLPDAHISLTLFAIVLASFFLSNFLSWRAKRSNPEFHPEQISGLL
jgi:hypothetical protein